MALKYYYLNSCDPAMCIDEGLPKHAAVGQRSCASLGAGSNVEQRGFTLHPVAIHYLFTPALMLHFFVLSQGFRLPNPSNDCVHLQGRRKERGVLKNRSAGPVKCNPLLAAAPLCT